MARLPGGRFLIQQIDRQVVLFEDMTEREIVRFDPSDMNAVAMAQKVIYDSKDLTDEEKCFAHVWSGYFYAYGPRQDAVGKLEELAKTADPAAREAYQHAVYVLQLSFPA